MLVTAAAQQPQLIAKATETATSTFSTLGQHASRMATNVASFAMKFFTQLGTFLTNFASKAWNFCKAHTREIALLGGGVAIGALALVVWNKVFGKSDEAPKVDDAPADTTVVAEDTAAEETTVVDTAAEDTAAVAEDTATVVEDKPADETPVVVAEDTAVVAEDTPVVAGDTEATA